jgi:predicted dithiol-disulfide oxidoreductase (DUF899 family)
MVTVSRAPLSKLDPFKRRMGWNFKWISSYGNDFNWDYHVSFNAADVAKKQVYYAITFSHSRPPRGQASVFSARTNRAPFFHTYSSFSRGLDMFIVAYHLLDIVPKGRDESGFT